MISLEPVSRRNWSQTRRLNFSSEARVAIKKRKRREEEKIDAAGSQRGTRPSERHAVESTKWGKFSRMRSETPATIPPPPAHDFDCSRVKRRAIQMILTYIIPPPFDDVYFFPVLPVTLDSHGTCYDALSRDFRDERTSEIRHDFCQRIRYLFFQAICIIYNVDFAERIFF